MQRIKSSNTVTSFPTKTDDGDAGYFTPGNTATGEKATYLSADWCNTMQEELVALATASGLALDTDDNGQCATAVAALISTAVAALKTTLEAAIALKAPIANPTLTGTPCAPTAAVGTSSTQIATTAFVASAKQSIAYTMGTSSQSATSVLATKTVTLSAAGTVRVIFTRNVKVVEYTYYLQLYVDDTQVTGGWVETGTSSGSSDDTLSAAPPLIAIVSGLTAGSHTFEVRYAAAKSGGSITDNGGGVFMVETVNIQS